jgi:hypothetical protein
MRVANRFRVTHFADHVVLRFGFSEADDIEDFGEQLDEVVLPITTATRLAMKLFESVIRSTVDITQFFTELQDPMAKLNALSAEASTKKEAITGAAESAKAAKAKAGV